MYSPKFELKGWDFPVSQLWQEVTVASVAYWPPPQALHITEAAVVCPWYLPLTQSAQTVFFVVKLFPESQNLQ